MKHSRPASVALVLALALLGPRQVGSAVQEGKEKKQQSPVEQKVRKLMELTGAGTMGKQVMDAMCDQFDKLPNLPEGFIAKFKEIASGQDIVDLVVPIYVKHLDEASLDAIIAFYQTEAGKKFIKAQPALMKESMEVGQKWGQELAVKALKALQEEKKDK